MDGLGHGRVARCLVVWVGECMDRCVVVEWVGG